MMRLGATVLVLPLAFACATHGEIAKDVRDIVGVTHVAGRYHLTGKDFLNEGADQILALGSRVIKVWFWAGVSGRVPESYPYNSQWPKAESLVAGAQTPYFKDLFRKPFTTYILVVASLGRDEAYWRKGITDEQKKDEQRQFYELTKYLLTQYRGTGKTFVLQHWEGDWLVRGNYKGDREPASAALANMVEWLNARQAGVNQARQEVGQQGVHVYHAAEVNRVVQSMRTGFPNLVNKVLPHTHLDLVSYSAWDSATEHYSDPKVLREALDFIAANAPDGADFGNRNVYVGEFGMPENMYSLVGATHASPVQQAIPNAVRTALDWGCPYIVYWQLYCNELKDPNAKVPVQSNDAVRGFWLIRPDGTKSWLWDYFRNLFTAPNRPARSARRGLG